jgi:hypothetical protein
MYCNPTCHQAPMVLPVNAARCRVYLNPILESRKKPGTYYAAICRRGILPHYFVPLPINAAGMLRLLKSPFSKAGKNRARITLQYVDAASCRIILFRCPSMRQGCRVYFPKPSQKLNRYESWNHRQIYLTTKHQEHQEEKDVKEKNLRVLPIFVVKLFFL